MTTERDEQREQLIDDVVQRLIMGESIRYITDSGAPKSVTMGDLLIKEVEDHGDGFKDFMSEVHIMCNVNLRSAEPGRIDANDRLRMQRHCIAGVMGIIARPWVEDYIEDIERDIAETAASDRARAVFEDRENQK